MWDIIRLPGWIICIAHCIEYEDDKIWRINIRLFLRLTCNYWLTSLKAPRSEIGRVLGYEVGSSVGMVMGSLVRYKIGYSTGMLIGLALGSYFCNREGYLVGISLGALSDLMIDNGEGSLVGFSLGLPIGSTLEYPNPGAMLGSLFGSIVGTNLDMSLGNTIGYLLESIWNVN